MYLPVTLEICEKIKEKRMHLSTLSAKRNFNGPVGNFLVIVWANVRNHFHRFICQILQLQLQSPKVLQFLANKYLSINSTLSESTVAG